MAIKNRFLPANKNLTPAFSRRILPLVVASIGLGQAHAVEFNIGEIEGRFDSQLSIGASFRNSSRDSRLFSSSNGGTGLGSGSFDDGNQNFDNGDAFSTIVKGLHEADFRYENYGFFTRAKYWYDYELENGSRAHGHTANQYVPGAELNDAGFNDFAKFSGFEILDAYLYAGFDIGDKPIDARLGRQVVNWGESTFIQGGLNSINPVDVNAFRRPGAEVKEGLLPINVAFASAALTDNLSIEGFYQFEWEPTAIDGCGTYFSTNDFVAEGCDGIRVNVGGFANLTDQAVFNNPSSIPVPDPIVRRDSNGRREASDDDQFGIALRYFSEELNNTEFGFYAGQYNSRLPIASGIANFDATLLGQAATAQAAAQAAQAAAQAAVLAGNLPLAQTQAATAQAQAQAAQSAALLSALSSRYFVEYPEEIGIFGLSFSTNLGNVAWSGEISHRTDVPLQINGASLVSGILSQGRTSNQAVNNLVQNTIAASGGAAGVIAAGGAEINGFRTFDVTQLQTTFVSFQDRVLGASRLTLIGELGWTHVHDLDESADAFKFGRNGVFGFSATNGNVNDNEGFVTKDSFGYVVRANLQYPDAIAGFSLRPQISFRHGIDGYGPQPGPAFNEDERVLGLSLQAEYQNRFTLELAYTDFFGGRFNAISDRDFISLSASVSY